MTLPLIPVWLVAILACWAASMVLPDRRRLALLLTAILAAELARHVLLEHQAPLPIGRGLYLLEYGAVSWYCVCSVSRISWAVQGVTLGLVWAVPVALACASARTPWECYVGARVLVIGLPLLARWLAPAPADWPTDVGILWGWHGVSDLVTGTQRCSVATQYAALGLLTALEGARLWIATRRPRSLA